LVAFVKDNNLDGVDLDWEDNDAVSAGKGNNKRKKVEERREREEEGREGRSWRLCEGQQPRWC
jgi:hypothetical protein